MVQAKHNRKGASTEDRSQGMCKSFYFCGATPSHPKKKCLTRDAEGSKCWKKGHFKGSYMSKKEEKEVGRTTDLKRRQRPMTVHELKAQATTGTWLQQPYMTQSHPILTMRTTGSDVLPNEDGLGEHPQ